MTPTAADTSTVRKHLRALARDGLVAANTDRRPHIWFLTGAGLAEARRAGLAEHRITAVTGEHVAASPAYAHALAVTDTAIVLPRAGTGGGRSRRLGGRSRPPARSRRPAHPGRRPAPALPEPAARFVELDRATMSIGRLLNKTAAYDRYRYYTHRPAGPPAARPAGAGPTGLPDWFTRYPRAGAERKFPPLLIVLAGKKKATLENRAADILAGIDDVWSAVTDPARLSRWLGDFEGDLRLGGEYRARYRATGWEGTGRIVVCEPPRRLVVTGVATDEPGEELVTEVTLTADGDRTVLTLEERGMPARAVAAYGAGNQIHVEDLGAHLAGRGNCDAGHRWSELQPGYAALEVTAG